jgi:hypothetical protein
MLIPYYNRCKKITQELLLSPEFTKEGVVLGRIAYVQNTAPPVTLKKVEVNYKS